MYWVYILPAASTGLSTSGSQTILSGASTSTEARLRGFTSRYGVDRLVWFKAYDDPTSAIDRERELKKWRREWKINLVERDNLNWNDLYDEITR